MNDIVMFHTYIYYISPSVYTKRNTEVGRGIISRIVELSYISGIVDYRNLTSTLDQSVEILTLADAELLDIVMTQVRLYITKFKQPKLTAISIGILDDTIDHIKEN